MPLQITCQWFTSMHPLSLVFDPHPYVATKKGFTSSKTAVLTLKVSIYIRGIRLKIGESDRKQAFIQQINHPANKPDIRLADWTSVQRTKHPAGGPNILPANWASSRRTKHLAHRLSIWPPEILSGLWNNRILCILSNYCKPAMFYWSNLKYK